MLSAVAKLKRYPVRTALYTFLVVYSLLTLYPLVWAFLNSLKTNPELMASSWSLPTELHWENYVGVWQAGRMPIYYRNTLIVTMISVATITLFSSLAGYAFARLTFKGREMLFYVLLVGMMVPPQQVLIPLYSLLERFQLYDTFGALILPYTGAGVAFSTFLLRAYFLSLPAEIEDAARIDGCSNFTIFWRIVLPLSKPGLATVVIFQAMAIYNDFLYPLTFITTPERKTLAYGLISYMGTNFYDYVGWLAAIIVVATPVATLYILMQKQFIRGLTAGAVKE